MSYINRKDAGEFLFKRIIETALNNTDYICDASDVYQNVAERIRKYWINDIPAADVIEQKTGSWEERIVDDPLDKYGLLKRRWYCSACGRWQTFGATDYCCRCGARMVKNEK